MRLHENRFESHSRCSGIKKFDTLYAMKYTQLFLSFGIMVSALFGATGLPHAAFADDGLTQAPILNTPVAGTYNTITLSYTLPEVPLSGSVQVLFVNSADEVRTLTMSNEQSVEFSFDPAGSAADLLASSSAVVSVSPSSTPILPDETYTVIVSYQDASGNEAATDMEASVVIDATAPSEVLDLAAEATGNDVLLTWTNPVFDFSSLTIRRSSISYPTSISDGTLVISDSIASMYADTNLVDSTYYYSIFTQDSLGNTSSGAQISVLVDTVAPSAPTDFAAVQDGTNVHLTWTNPTDPDFYFVTIQQQSGDYPATVNDGGTAVSGLVGTAWDNDGLSEGLHYFSIFAYDTTGNIAEAAHASVVVDLTGPAITLSGENEVTAEAGEEYTDAGATALDVNDGEVAVLTTGTVDTSVLDDYILTYSAVDTNGHEAEAVTRTVHVVDTTVPVITVLGESEVTLYEGDTYTDAGATAEDSFEGDITESLLINSTVDTTQEGAYVVTYDVVDSSGNSAVQVVRTVNVLAVSEDPEVEEPEEETGSPAEETTPGAPVVTTNGKTVVVTVDDIVVDNERIAKDLVKAKYRKIVVKRMYTGYKTVVVLTVRKHTAHLAVLRLNKNNQLRNTVKYAFDITDRTSSMLKVKASKKRIHVRVGAGDDATERILKLTKKGNLQVLSE